MNFFEGDWEVDVGGDKVRITIQDAGRNLVRILLTGTTTVIGHGSTLSVGNAPGSITFFRRAGTDVHYYSGDVEMNCDPTGGSPIRPTRVRGRHVIMLAPTHVGALLDDEWTGTRPPE